MNNSACKMYIESIKNDFLKTDFFFEDKILLKKSTEILINNEICLLESLKHKGSNFNSILQNQINFLEDCLILLNKNG